MNRAVWVVMSSVCLGVFKGGQTWAGDVTGKIQALERQWGSMALDIFSEVPPNSLIF